jgi:hypothetical protein
MACEMVFTTLSPADVWEEKWTAAAGLCWNGRGRE